MPIENNTQLSWIKHRFREKGYTQEEFAKAIGCGYSHFSKSTNERDTCFTLDEIKSIANLLEIPQGDIGKLFGIGVIEKAEPQRRTFVLKSVSSAAYR